jgi:hypothetical protein
MQPTPQQSNNEPTITAKIRVVDDQIRLLKDCGDTANLTMLKQYRRFLEQQLKIIHQKVKHLLIFGLIQQLRGLMVFLE